jgi:nucleotide-binding universal stress UspA family protein
MTLVHAVQLPRLPAAYGIDVAETNLEEVQARSRSTLEEWGGEVDVAADKLSTVVTTGDPASTILETASTPEALLVMATQGLSGLKRAVLGSVAESVLRRAVGPVLAGRSFPE